jgi:hypothetical protein
MELEWPNAREVKTTAADWTAAGEYNNCPIVSPTEINDAAWTDIVGKLSTKLLQSNSTTYVKVVLDRVG